MLFTALAIMIMFASALMILMNLRSIAQDTVDAILHATAGGRAADRVVPAAAFALLWLLIFALCYL